MQESDMPLLNICYDLLKSATQFELHRAVVALPEVVFSTPFSLHPGLHKQARFSQKHRCLTEYCDFPNYHNKIT